MAAAALTETQSVGAFAAFFFAGVGLVGDFIARGGDSTPEPPLVGLMTNFTSEQEVAQLAIPEFTTKMVIVIRESPGEALEAYRCGAAPGSAELEGPPWRRLQGETPTEYQAGVSGLRTESSPVTIQQTSPPGAPSTEP